MLYGCALADPIGAGQYDAPGRRLGMVVVLVGWRSMRGIPDYRNPLGAVRVSNGLVRSQSEDPIGAERCAILKPDFRTIIQWRTGRRGEIMATQGYSNPDLLVESDWLAERLDDPNIRIVDCDPREVYRRAHIKNAVGIPVHHYIKHPEYESDARKYPLVAPPDTMKEVMESMGIGDANLVVAYDSNGSLWSSRLWWALNYYGHTEVKVLNGGWRKWFGEGRPIEDGRPQISAATFTPRANEDLLCTLDYGVANVGNSDVVFLDVRSDGEWDGTNARGNQRAGRIPGSVHLEWLNFITDDKFQTIKPAEELRAMLDAAGVTSEKDVVTY